MKEKQQELSWFGEPNLGGRWSVVAAVNRRPQRKSEAEQVIKNLGFDPQPVCNQDYIGCDGGQSSRIG